MRMSIRPKTAAFVAALAILSAGVPSPARSADAGPIKVALLAPTSGSAAAAGHDMVAGWELFWKERGGKVAGRTVQTTVYDTGSNAARALDQARHAVEQDGAQIIVGPYLANEGLAVAPYGIQHRIPMFFPTVSADDLSQRQANAFVIKVAGWTSSQTTHVAGEWAYEQGHRKIVTLANSYAFGYENAGGFAQTFTRRAARSSTRSGRRSGPPTTRPTSRRCRRRSRTRCSSRWSARTPCTSCSSGASSGSRARSR